MGRARELDPNHLGISSLFTDVRDIQVNLMLGQQMIQALREALNPEGFAEVMQNSTLLSVEDLGGGRLRMVSGVEEEVISPCRLIYGIFTPEGQLLPDPYACARVIGRYQRVQEVRHRIVELLE